MACRFPGAGNLDAFWKLLSSGRGAITEVPPGRWDPGMFADYDPITNGEMLIQRAGFVDGIDQFDPYFFKISPREACRIDPQQRLLLEVAWEALEHGGQASSQLAGSSTGVFIGMMSNEYEEFLGSKPDEFDVYDVPGNTYSIAANRISYQFDLCGPSLTVDTACSSSLVCVHLACQSLRNQECGMALAGGVNAIVSPYPSIKYFQMGMLSIDGLCKTFDASANGYVRGEGAGIVVLKRLSDALRDNDNILACIRGSAINQNGRGVGLTAPSSEAQTKVIGMALQSAGIQAKEIDYVEAHGTGTPIGDPIEVRALAEALREGRDPGQQCLLGSVKTNIGHTESAAGVAGLIKVVLSLQNAHIPAHRNLKNINPRLESTLDTFRIPSKLTPWPRGEKRRYAGINSFGFGGANAHIVLEEAPVRDSYVESYKRPFHVMRLSAQTDTALQTLALRYIGWLENYPEQSIEQVCYSANTGRLDYEKKVAICAETTEQLRRNLKKVLNGEPDDTIQIASEKPVDNPKIAFIFSGQSTKWMGIVRELYETHHFSRNTIIQCSDYLMKHWQTSLLDYLCPEEEDAPRIADTWMREPALFVLEYVLARLWMSWGVKPDALIGYGVGEYAAACIAKVFTLEEGLHMVTKRASLVASLSPNEPIENIIDSYKQELETVNFCSPNMPIVSAHAGRRFTGHQVGANYWVSLALSPMSIANSAKQIAQSECDIFLEIGPDSTVCSNLQKTVSQDCLLLPSLRTDETYWKTLSRTLAKLYVNNIQVDWEGYDQGYSRYKVPLPTYPFERQRCWYGDTEKLVSGSPRSVDTISGNENIEAIYEAQPISNQMEYERTANQAARKWIGYEKLIRSDQPVIRDHIVSGKPVLPAAMYLDMALQASEKYTGRLPHSLENVVVASRLELDLKGTQLAQVVMNNQDTENGSLLFRIESPDATVYASGEVVVNVDGEAPPLVNIAVVRERCTHSVDAKQIYARYADIGIEYRAGFQSISWFARSDVEALAHIKLTENVDSGENYRLHPIILDGALQVLGAFYLDAGTKGTFLPFAIEKIAIFSRLPTSVYCHLRAARNAQQIQPDDELCKGDLTLTDAEGKVLVQMDGVSLKRAKSGIGGNQSRAGISTRNENMGREPVQMLQKLLHQAGWRPCSIGARAETDSASTWLVLTDEGEIGKEMMKMLCENGDTCIPVFAAETFSASHNEYRIAKENPGDYHKLVSDIYSRGIIPTGVIHMWRCTRPEPFASSLKELEGDLDSGVYSLLYLTQSLTAQFKEALKLWIVTSYGQAVERRSDKYVYPDKAALWGLAKVIPKEYARVQCAGIDLETSGRSSRELAATIFSEIKATPGDIEFESWIAYLGNKRMVATLRPVRNVKYAQPLPLRQNGAYLVSGGQGGVGLEIAKFIASKVKARLVLLNRSPLDEVRYPDRAAGIRELEAMGADVMIECGDVSDLEVMTQLVDRVRRRWGPINGVIHSAGVLKDGLVPGMDHSHFSEVLKPKVQGTWVLDEVTRGSAPDFFVMCSSMVTQIAPMGQSTHVAACSFEDSFALHRTALHGLKTLCINWGLWGDTGVVSGPEYKEALEAQGVYAMSNAEGVAGFAWSLASGLSRVVCGSVRTVSGGSGIEYGLPQQAFSDYEEVDESEDSGIMREEIDTHSQQEIPGIGGSSAKGKSVIELEFDNLCTAYITRALISMGWKPRFRDQFTTHELANELNIMGVHHQLLNRFLDILSEDGFIKKEGQSWVVVNELTNKDPSMECLRMLNEYPSHRSDLLLIAHCAEKLAESVRGEIESLEVLFPGGSMDKLEELYEESPFFSLGNRLLKKTLGSMLEHLPDDRPLKVLEIGAGTAATTKCLLPIFKGRQIEYVFTDMSNLFLRKADRKLAAYPFVRYQLFDVEKDPSTQNLDRSGFDIVIAAHALHATRDMRQTLTNVHKLMVPGGVMLLVESVQRQRWKDIVFGITDGWWRFVDSDVRPKYPILAPDAWRLVLEEVGFTDYEAVFSDEELAEEQGIIIARMPKQEEGCIQPINRRYESMPEVESHTVPVNAFKRTNGSLERWVQQHLIEQMAASLRVPAERIYLDRSFSDMGVDSLVGVEIIGKLRKELGVPLAPTLLFEYSTVEALGAHLIENYEKELQERDDVTQSHVSGEDAGFENTGSEAEPGIGERNRRVSLHTIETPDATITDEGLVHMVYSTVTGHVAKSLRVPLDRLIPDKNFSEMGIDSLVGVEIISALKKELGVPLAPTLLFEYPTLELLAQHIAHQYGESLKASMEPAKNVDTKGFYSTDTNKKEPTDKGSSGGDKTGQPAQVKESSVLVPENMQKSLKRTDSERPGDRLSEKSKIDKYKSNVNPVSNETTEFYRQDAITDKDGDAKLPSPEVLLHLYEELPTYCQRAIDNTPSYEEANKLILKLSTTQGN